MFVCLLSLELKKMTKFRQKLQISHFDVIRALYYLTNKHGGEKKYSEIFCILKPSYFALFVKVYKVLIKLPDGRSYFIFRRYNEFHQLCDKVQMYCKEDSICLQTLIRGSDVISSCVLYSQLSP